MYIGTAQIILAAVFASAAMLKLIDIEMSQRALAGRFALPSAPLLAVLIASEIAVALLMAVSPTVGGYLAVLLLTIFTVVLADDRRKQRGLPCRCFGRVTAEPPKLTDLARNFGLMALALLVALAS